MPRVFSGFPGLFESTVCIFCCALEKMSLRLELQAAKPFSCELPLVPLWGWWLENGLFWLSGSDLARKGHKLFSFLTQTNHWPVVLVTSF